MTLNEINTTTPEGVALFGALIVITTEVWGNKTPDECLAELEEMGKNALKEG